MRLDATAALLTVTLLCVVTTAAPPHLASLIKLLPRQNDNTTTSPPPPPQGEPGLNATQNQPDGSNDTITGLRCATSNGSEPLRPQIHYSPSSGLSGAPNGLIRVNDTWHMYFQYSPNLTVTGNQSWLWGHASSPNLLEWTNEPITFTPEIPDQGFFSGSVVVDVNNTSGLFGNDTNPDSRVILFYKIHTPVAQERRLAVGDGFNFTTPADPVIREVNQTQFRDSSHNWNGTAWIVAFAQSQVFQVTFFSSPDFKNGTELSSFSGGLQGYQYESPILQQLPAVGGPRDGEVLNMLLLTNSNNPGLGGSVQQFFLGDFKSDGAFVPLDNLTRIMDWGKDLSAAQTAYTSSPETVMIAAVGNSEYAQQVPTANETSGWRGEMTLARSLSAVWSQITPQYSAYSVVQVPYNLTPISGQELAPAGLSGNVSVELRGEGAFNIQAAFSVPSSANLTAPSYNFTGPAARLRVRSSGSGNLTFGANFGLPVIVWADRRKAGTQWADDNVFFTDRFSNAQMPLRRVANDTSSDYIVTMQLIVDRIISELFVNNGSSTATVLTFWDNEEVPAFVDLELTSSDITLDSFSVVPLNSTWDCRSS